jgi:hypothetical protein
MVQRVNFAPDLPDPSLVPASLKQVVEDNPQELCTNHIDTGFCVPADDKGDGRPEVRGVLRMEGYTIPNPDHANRYDTWFVRGRCFKEPDEDAENFAQRFGSDESMFTYTLPNMFQAYQTVVYLDDDMRISVGNRGSVMINCHESVYFQG